MRFSDVKHQARALAVIRRALRSGRAPHAYLFEGPEGVGKELAAQALAARLLCLEEKLAPDADACGRCSSCRLVAADNHPDFHLIHRGLHKSHPDRGVRASKGLFLVVDLVRHFLIEPAGMKPTQGRRRVFLIRDAERMNDEAQNALLKTLEEPPGTACLILVTASASRLLPTVRSRCQLVPFDPLPVEFVTERLVARTGTSPADGRTLATLAGGRLGVALRWHGAGVLQTLGEVGAGLDSLTGCAPESFGRMLVAQATALAQRARDEGDEREEPADEVGLDRAAGEVLTDELREALKVVLLLVASLYREALLAKVGAAGLCSVPQQRQRVTRLAAAHPHERIEASLESVCEAERMLDRNVAPQLVGERLGVALAGGLLPTDIDLSL